MNKLEKQSTQQRAENKRATPATDVNSEVVRLRHESELLREAKQWEKKHPTENYYEPNFPVIRATDRAFEPICEELAGQMAELFEAKQAELNHAFEKTSLANQGWEFSDLAQYCYASAQRGARKLLEKRRVLAPCEKHKDGGEWLFWAEEPNSSAKR